MSVKNNNAILFLFTLIFLLIGFVSPMINSEYKSSNPEYDTGIIEDIGQEDITSTNVISILSGIFFWVFGAPPWLNIILTLMRVIFWIVIYDKIRGI